MSRNNDLSNRTAQGNQNQKNRQKNEPSSTGKNQLKDYKEQKNND